jgi:hypothetical protein
VIGKNGLIEQASGAKEVSDNPCSLVATWVDQPVARALFCVVDQG